MFHRSSTHRDGKLKDGVIIEYGQSSVREASKEALDVRRAGSSRSSHRPWY